MADTLDDLKQNTYALRNITAVNKYYTFLSGDDIYVGPFKPEVIETIENRRKLLKEWETPYVILPVAYENEEWVIFDNFTKEYTIVKDESTYNERLGFWIAHFYEIDKLNKVCEKEEWVYTADLLEAYVHLWLLNVGNSMFTDTYVNVDKEDIYILDYDLERLGKSATEDAFFFFPKPPHSRCKWFQHMGKYYKEVGDRLDKIKQLTPEYTDRVLYAQEMLDNFYEKWEKEYGYPSTTSVSSGSSILPTKPLSQPILGDIGQPMGIPPPLTGSSSAGRGKAPIPPRKPLPAPGAGRGRGGIVPGRGISSGRGRGGIVPGRGMAPGRGGLVPGSGRGRASSSSSSSTYDIGKMVSHPRGGTTYSGYKINDVKKYLQSYVRLGMEEKARIAGVELYRIKELTDSSAKSNYTSFINTLKYIALEDVGIADFDLTIAIIDILNKTPDLPFDIIDRMVMDMTTTKKTHLSEQVWKTYTDPKCVSYAENRAGLIVDKIFTKEDEAFIDANLHASFFDKKDSENVREYALVFYKRLLDKDINAVTWWNYFVAATKNEIIEPRDTYHDGVKWKRVGKREPTVILWNIMDTLYDNEVLNILRWGYFNDVKKSDSRFYPLLAILAILYNVPYTPIDIVPSDNYNWLLNGDYTFNMNENIKGSGNELVPESEIYYNDEYAMIANHC